MAREQHRYNDQWIFDHFDPNKRWSQILKEYNQAFGTKIKYPTFVSHMNRELKLQQEFRYTDEQEDFLKKTYPVHGRQKTTAMFNQLFGTKRTEGAIQHHCKDILGIYVNEERKVQNRKETGERNYRKCPVGAVSSGLYGTPSIKTENGWERLDQRIIGTPGPDEIIVHLDMNPENNDPDNLMIIEKAITAMMAKNHFWSENPMITKTGILWCQLDRVLMKDGYSRAIRENYRKAHQIKEPDKRKTPKLASIPKSNTGELYIYKNKRDSHWRVTFNNQYLQFNKAFSSFERAKQVRDMLLDGLKKKYKMI